MGQFNFASAKAQLDSQKGIANGFASLDASGLVPSNQLPSYVDDVLEYASTSAFPATGDVGKIYVATDTNKSYRWSGSTYVELSSYALATQAAAGLMSAVDKTKLDGIATGATNVVVSNSLSDTSTTNALSAAKGKELSEQIGTLNSDITTLTSKFNVLKASSINSNASLAIDNSISDAIFIVAIGGWNYSQLFSVMTSNGGAPKKQVIQSYITTDYFPVTANGNWGFTVTNNTSYGVNCVVFIIKKN